MNPPLQLKRKPDGRPGLLTENGIEPVVITACFPWSDPGKFLSLRSPEGRELGFVEDPADLEPESKDLILEELARGSATFQIQSIQVLRKEIELRCWEVITDRGPRSFQTELDEWPRELPGGSFLIEDLFGDLYVVTDLQTLDPASRKLFWPLIG